MPAKRKWFSHHFWVAFFQGIVYNRYSISGCGPVGRALDLGSRCREFESPHSDQRSRNGISPFLLVSFLCETRTFSCSCPVGSPLPTARRRQLHREPSLATWAQKSRIPFGEFRCQRVEVVPKLRLHPVYCGACLSFTNSAILSAVYCTCSAAEILAFPSPSCGP